MLKNLLIFTIFIIIKCIQTQSPLQDCEVNQQLQGYDVNCDNEISKELFPKRDFDSAINNILLLEANNQVFSTIPSNFLSGLSVVYIELNNNGIKEIHPDAFENVNNVESVQLNTNLIETLPESLFTPIRLTLKQLSLTNNHLNRMDINQLSKVLNNAPHLVALFLNANELDRLPNLRSNIYLQELELFQNKLTTLVDPQTGESLLPHSLTMLDLGNNQLKTIEPSFFKDLKHLKLLNLRYNLIQTIGDNAFVNLVSLEHLQLSKNSIKHVSENLLQSVRHLTSLDVSQQKNGQLVRLDDFVFDTNNATSQLKLDLHGNRISSLGKRVFCSRKQRPVNILSIDLNNNAFESLDVLAFTNLRLEAGRETRTRVDLNGNLKCDCSIQYLSTLVDLEGKCLIDNNKRVSMSEYICDDQAEFIELSKKNLDEYSCNSQSASTPLSSDSVSNDDNSNNNNNNNNNDNNNVKPADIKAGEDKSLSETTLAPANPVLGSATSVFVDYKLLILTTFFILFKNSLF